MINSETNREQRLDHWAERVHRSGLGIVVLPLLEIGQGLGFLAGQALLLAQPVLTSLFDEVNAGRINRWVALLDDPVALESLIERIERKAEGDG